jgi:hypothetical protein
MDPAISIIQPNDHQYIRPDTLKEGNQYLLLEDHPCCGRLVQETVQFVSYTACPGTVIVLDSKNQRFCTARDHLFFSQAYLE